MQRLNSEENYATMYSAKSSIMANIKKLFRWKPLPYTKEAQRLETEIYDQLYGNNLTLVGWYHSSPRGPALPTVKDSVGRVTVNLLTLSTGSCRYYRYCKPLFVAI
jgi:proteasome lid subunit RPN8/RPN11